MVYLKPAQLYKEQLRQEFIKTWYDPKYQFYYEGSERFEFQIPDNANYRRDFAIVENTTYNENEDKVIGYIGYSYSNENLSAMNFGFMNFCKTDVNMFKYLIKVIWDIFFTYRLERIEFRCFEGNTTLQSYRSLIKRYGGVEVGKLRCQTRAIDGTKHDCYIFEVLLSDLKYDESGCLKLTKDHNKFWS